MNSVAVIIKRDFYSLFGAEIAAKSKFYNQHKLKQINLNRKYGTLKIIYFTFNFFCHRSPDHEFLGCMSFGVQGILVKRKVS